MSIDLEKLFLHEKAVNILIKIYEYEKAGKKAYPLSISRDVGSPYSYISKVLGIFERAAIIESKFEGRVKRVKLTEDGKEIAEQFLRIKNLLNRDFLARKKLRIIEAALTNGNDPNRLLPIKAELENLKTNDEEVIKRVEELKKKVGEMLNGSP